MKQPAIKSSYRWIFVAAAAILGPISTSHAQQAQQQRQPVQGAKAQPKGAKGASTNLPVTLAGRALDANGKPIAGAKIYISTRTPQRKLLASTTSDADGKYQFSDLPLTIPGGPAVANRRVVARDNFYVFGQAEGFGFAWRPPLVFSGVVGALQHVELEQDLTFAPERKLRGTVVNENDEPIADAELDIRFTDNIPSQGNNSDFQVLSDAGVVPSELTQRTTDAQGKFEFTGLPADCRFRISIQSPPLANRTIVVATKDGVIDDDGKPLLTDGMTITLFQPMAVPIQVLYGDTGKPVANAHVSGGDLSNTFEGTTNAEGQVTLHLPPGHYQAGILAPLDEPYLSIDSMQQNTTQFEVERSPPEAPIVFRLPRAAVLEVSVIDPITGNGVPGFQLWQADATQPLNHGQVFYRSWNAANRATQVHFPQTDASGKLRALFPAGPCRIGVGFPQPPDGYEVLEPNGQEVNLQPGEPATLTFHAGKIR